MIHPIGLHSLEAKIFLCLAIEHRILVHNSARAMIYNVEVE